MADSKSDNSSVKVAVRLRPLVRSEIEKGCKNILEVHKELSQVHVKDTDKAFTFNYVLDTDATQVDMYDICIKEVIPNLFKGFNLTILAYGQTGSGKTYSMGTTCSEDEEMGIIPRSVNQIFEFVKDNFVFDFTISVSFMELYQEVLYDLLSGKAREQCILDIREDPQRGIYLPGLTEVVVESAQDVLNCLVKGSSGRATASTNMNSQSSRSHAIFTLNICMQARNNIEENKTAKFHLVDLAGSERPKKTGAVGTTFREGVNINKGLLVLGNVISALGEEKQQENRFIPYRDSNLTRLLKDSLGGNSITLMIACVSPADYNIDETLSTLRYADRARKIKNKPIVNQDPKTAQINDLKKTVKMLQLQLIGQGGVTVSSEEIIMLKKEISDLKLKIRDLMQKLSSALNDNAGLLEKLILLQNSNEMLSKKIASLKKAYDVTLNNITFAMENGSTDSLIECKTKFEDIKTQFQDLDSEMKKAEAEIKTHEDDIDNLNENSTCSEVQSNERNEIMENFATRQIELNSELKDTMKKLAMKEMLAKEMAKNAQNMVDYDNIRQNELRIEALEKEKSELLQQLKNAQQNCPSKVSEDRRRRVKELESQIHDLMKKLNEQNRLIRLKEKDELKMKQLHQEILQMRQNKVKLVRNMKEESERFRTWKLQRERELAKLKQEDIKKKNQIQKMQTMHLKQQNVLKRKVQEAVAANKRLKDAMAKRKAAKELKFSGRLDKVTSWLKEELEVLFGFTEIELTLAGLLEDRALLQKQLDTLRSDSNPDLGHIKSIEDDIELRSVQIQDMQQKLLDTDEDSKNKINLDNLQTMAEAKQALKVLIDEAVDLKKKQCVLNMKSMELEDTPNEEHQERKNFEEKLRTLEQNQNVALSRIEQEYQEKIFILLGQLRGEEVKASSVENESLVAIIKMQQNKLEEQEKKLDEINRLLDENKKQTELIKLQNSKDKATMSTIQDVTPSKKIKFLDKPDETFTVIDDPNKENKLTTYADMEVSFSDDITKDPDWVKTPIGRKMMTKLNYDVEEEEQKARTKRSSDGGCACTTNCSKRCGCRKTSRECTNSCKCNILNCTNREINVKDSKSLNNLDESTNFKKLRTKI
ncbi:hypothetical protein HHI36_001479 [Cryptolaemus montrouzieri]|uniref:Chromosome-associated kinesin KIF4A n=1 Tax=Cryptolaemus montrouzieri TaxID=559131 RepID=A0ABD2P7S4_9CUCU